MKKILVPCDFSPPAQEAFRFALEIASISHGELFVVKAIDMPITYESAFGVQPYVMNPALIKDIEEDSISKFEKMKSLYHTEKTPVSFHTVHGSVTPAVTQSIRDKKADLVVMGTHGSSGLQEFFFGSNTEKIVRLSPVPVFAIRKAPVVSSIKNILLPSPLDFNQNDFVGAVKDLQNFFSATLHILLVNTPARFKEYNEAQEALNEYAKHYKFKDYTLNVRNDVSEDDGILNFSLEINPDMIAMATHSRQGLAHLFSGSITEDVVNHTQYPIWTYSLKMSKE